MIIYEFHQEEILKLFCFTPSGILDSHHVYRLKILPATGNLSNSDLEITIFSYFTSQEVSRQGWFRGLPMSSKTQALSVSTPSSAGWLVISQTQEDCCISRHHICVQRRKRGRSGGRHICPFGKGKSFPKRLAFMSIGQNCVTWPPWLSKKLGNQICILFQLQWGQARERAVLVGQASQWRHLPYHSTSFPPFLLFQPVYEICRFLPQVSHT